MEDIDDDNEQVLAISRKIIALILGETTDHLVAVSALINALITVLEDIESNERRARVCDRLTQVMDLIVAEMKPADDGPPESDQVH